MNVAFVAAEVVPYAKTGGLGDVCGTLPSVLKELGVSVEVFMPGYGCIDRGKYRFKKVNAFFSMARARNNIPVYIIDSPKYFSRKGLYGSRRGEYKDNLERFHLFNEAVLKGLKLLGKKIDVIHCHDWHASLIPVLLKEKYADDPFFQKIKVLLTIHNLAYQGLFDKEKFSRLGLGESLFNPERFEFYGRGNLLKAGIIYSDAVNTVSPQYAKEIQTKEFGCGLEDLLKHNKHKLSGILNGIDYSIWGPQRDKFIEKRYTPENAIAGKRINKEALQRWLRLPVSKTAPLFGFVGRLSHQKGIDLIIAALPELMKSNCQIVIQGVGDRHYESQLKLLAATYKEKFSVCIDFDEGLAHQVYAASDFFLMPSNFEPCGLSQMISLHYGTIPIVFKTGGLADTVKSIDKDKENGNGIIFQHYQPGAFISSIHSAENFYKDARLMGRLMKNAFKSLFPWENSAKQYKRLYQWLSSA